MRTSRRRGSRTVWRGGTEHFTSYYLFFVKCAALAVSAPLAGEEVVLVAYGGGGGEEGVVVEVADAAVDDDARLPDGPDVPCGLYHL